MKKLILFGLILSFGILAQENEDKYDLPKSLDQLTPEDIQNIYNFKSSSWDGESTKEEVDQNKYITFKPVTWDELQLYQLDSMLTAEELKLSKNCPTTLRKIQASHERTGQHFQNILYTDYIWSEYTNVDGLKCFVKHERIDTITPKEGKIINPNHYQLLNTTQARVLKSASQAIGFKEKGFFKQARKANLHNQKIRDKPYMKYGGMLNVVNYMEKHKPSYKVDPKYLENRTTTKNGVVVTKHIPLIELFEMRYSDEQKQELIEIVKEMEEQKKSQQDRLR